jgi:hypothetical protein
VERFNTRFIEPGQPIEVTFKAARRGCAPIRCAGFHQLGLGEILRTTLRGLP